MLKDISAMNPKGHVKLELYNEQEGVFYTKEKKNLVVQSANKIVAEMIADPAKVVRVSQVDKGDTALSANADLLYPFDLSVKRESKIKFENNWGAVNETVDFDIEDLKGIASLDEVKVGSAALVIDQDVFLIDAAKGKIKFAAAPKDKVTISFHKITNPYMQMIAGTEKVKVKGEAWTRAAVANSAQKKYKIDARTGVVLFETPQTKVEVSYDYNMNYSLGFMALGGKPNAQWPNYKPVEFGQSSKLEPDMKNELPDSRMAVQYPSSISYGATELEPSLPTKPIGTVTKIKSDLTIADNGDGSTKKLVYELPNVHETIGRTLHELVSVQNITKNAPVSVSNVAIQTNTLNIIEIKFRDEDVALSDVIRVEYRLKLDNTYLTYQLPQSPVVELVSVKHVNAATQEVVEYAVVGNGLRVNEGDVWISNPSTGHITFSSQPAGRAPRVETPGMLQVEYRVNSGTIVKFVADFPKGVPAAAIETATKSVTATPGQTAISLDYPIAKDSMGNYLPMEVKVTVSGATSTLTEGQYSISVDGKTVTINSLSAGHIVNISHKYERTTHDIYQVAMFDEKTGGKMFNISGIGPVTKDKNTGMRVTWSVTF